MFVRLIAFTLLIATATTESNGDPSLSELTAKNLQNRFGFIKTPINEQTAHFLPPPQFTSYLRPEDLSDLNRPDELKTAFAISDSPNPSDGDYPDRQPYGQPIGNSGQTMFQLLKGQLSKIPAIKAYLLTKEYPFPKLNQFTFPLNVEIPPSKPRKNVLWQYLKPKAIDASPSPHGDPQLDLPKPAFVFLPKPIPLDPSLFKDDALTLHINKFAIPDTNDVPLKLTPESEQNEQVFKEMQSSARLPHTEPLGQLPPQYELQPQQQTAQQQLAYKQPADNLDAISSQYSEQYAKQNPLFKDYYSSPYLRNPHLIATRPYSATWIPNSKKWHPGPHKSAFYPDTRLIKFTIEDRIYNNSTRKPHYVNYVIKSSTPSTTLSSTTNRPPIDSNEE